MTKIEWICCDRHLYWRGHWRRSSQSNRLWYTPWWPHAGWYWQILISRNWLVLVLASQKSNKKSYGRYTLGDKLLQHVAATDHSVCTGRATSCSNKVRRHVAATNRFVCAGEFLWKSLSPQQNLVAATSRKKSNQTESVRLVAATNSLAATKIFTKILQYTRSNLSLQLVATTCCCKLSPSVYRP